MVYRIEYRSNIVQLLLVRCPPKENFAECPLNILYCTNDFIIHMLHLYVDLLLLEKKVKEKIKPSLDVILTLM